MTGSYNLLLVFASYCVAVIAAYTAIYFGGRLFTISGRGRTFWLGAGAVCMGTGIWSMHFVGMSAYNMPMGMEMSFSAPLTAVSWIPAVLASALALYVITLPVLKIRGLLSSALIMGAGIFGMHYGGMLAMRMNPPIQYDPLLVALSGVIAVVASGAALVICRRIRQVSGKAALPVRVLAALVMGVAICGMHYTGMAAASYPMEAQMAAANSLRGDWMGIPTAVVASFLLLMAVYIAYMDFTEAERQRRERERVQEAAEQTAFFDSHTGMGNRAFLETQVLEKIKATGAADTPGIFRLYYFESGLFRELAKARGEACAQESAIVFAKRLAGALPEAECIARYSKHGFIALFGERGPSPSALLKRMNAALGEEVTIKTQTYSSAWSFGMSEFPRSGTNSRNLIRAAQRIRAEFGKQDERQLQPA